MCIRDRLCGRMRLTAWRAPTDNDQNMRAYWELVNIWQGENLDRLFSKVYECRLEKGIIRVTGALAGVSRLPFFRYTLSAVSYTHLICRISQLSGFARRRGLRRRDADWYPAL